MPNHIDMPAEGAPYNDCIAYVSQRNAPGAISAMALDVSPVRPSVGRVGVGDSTDTIKLLSIGSTDQSGDVESRSASTQTAPPEAQWEMEKRISFPARVDVSYSRTQ